jgi:hypothetical protein
MLYRFGAKIEAKREKAVVPRVLAVFCLLPVAPQGDAAFPLSFRAEL